MKYYSNKEVFTLALAHWNFLVDNPCADKEDFDMANDWYNACIFCEHMRSKKLPGGEGGCADCLMRSYWWAVDSIYGSLYASHCLNGGTPYDKWELGPMPYDRAFFALLMVENIQEVADETI